MCIRDSNIIGKRILAGSQRMEGIVVQLEEYPLLLGGTHNGLVIQRKTAVIRAVSYTHLDVYKRQLKPLV